MPEYNSIQTPRLERWARKLLGVRNGGLMPTLAPELGVALDVPQHIDTEAPSGYFPWGAWIGVSPVAAQFGYVSIINDGKQLLSVRMSGACSVAAEYQLVSRYTAGGGMIAATSVDYRDTRFPAGSFPLIPGGIRITGAASAAPVGTGAFIGGFWAPANTSVWSPWVTVSQNGVLTLILNVANTAFYCGIEAFVRAVDDDELTP